MKSFVKSEMELAKEKEGEREAIYK